MGWGDTEVDDSVWYVWWDVFIPKELQMVKEVIIINTTIMNLYLES